MCKTYKLSILLAMLFLLAGVSSYAQSLGDVARTERQKQQVKDAQTTSHKVITNEDIPERDDSEDDDSDADDAVSSAPRAAKTGRSAEQWKVAILAQKEAVASLQSEADKLNSSIHFVEANHYTNGVQYNQHQLKKQEQVERLQKQLEKEKKKLADMQEAARKEGFGNAVYDP